MSYSKNIIFHQFNDTDYVVDSVLKSNESEILISKELKDFKVSCLNGKINLENVNASNFSYKNEKYYIKVFDQSNNLVKTIQIRTEYYGPFQFLNHINNELSAYSILFAFGADGEFILNKTTNYRLTISNHLYKFFRGLLIEPAILKNNEYEIDLLITDLASNENNRSKFYTWNMLLINTQIPIENTSFCSNTLSNTSNKSILASLILNNKNEDASRNLVYIPDVLRENNISFTNNILSETITLEILHENGIINSVKLDPSSSNIIQLQFRK